MPKRIFLIEDDANTLFSLQAKFRVAGFEVAVHPGNETEEIIIEKIKFHSPDYLVLDLILPRADGLKILYLLKSSRELSSLPVFVFTNSSDRQSKEKGASLGVNYYLLKSELNTDQFVEKARKIMANLEKCLKN